MSSFQDETELINYSHTAIQNTVAPWRELPVSEAIAAAYYFVRDTIVLGYNPKDELPADWILKIGCGYGNTKATLLMALLRAMSIPCRLHGAMVDKQAINGIATMLVYKLAPKNLLHSWVEVLYDGRWYSLEGVIVDRTYMTRLQSQFHTTDGRFIGYGVAVDYLQNPNIDWGPCDTFVMRNAITEDLGVFESTDALFSAHGQYLSPVKAFLYRYYGRRRMNRKLNKARENPKPPRRRYGYWKRKKPDK